MGEFDYWDIPLFDFFCGIEKQEDGTTFARQYPLGDGAPQQVMVGLYQMVEQKYEDLLSMDQLEHLANTGEVPVFQDGETQLKSLDLITQRDLPSVFEAFAALEEERKREEQEERDRKAAEQYKRQRILARERYKRKKLGVW